jgi:hypothetical protein
MPINDASKSRTVLTRKNIQKIIFRVLSRLVLGCPEFASVRQFKSSGFQAVVSRFILGRAKGIGSSSAVTE